MSHLLRFTVSVRLCATVTFLCYLAAGASLTLPSLVHCVRCAKQAHHGSVQTGASCPLSYRGHDCHGRKGSSSGSIELCPDGCLRHEGQGGEVASIAKFLSPNTAVACVGIPVERLTLEQFSVGQNWSLAPPDPPPSLLA